EPDPSEVSPRFAQRPVHLRASVLDAVDFVCPGDVDDLFIPRTCRVESGVEGLLAIAPSGQEVAVTIDNPTLADEAESTLLPDAIDGGVVDVILQRPGLYEILDRTASGRGPVGRQQDHVGAE